MSMSFNDMSEALREAEQTNRMADRQAGKIARLLVGRCRHLSYNERVALVKLKRELADFDARTRTFKGE